MIPMIEEIPGKVAKTPMLSFLPSLSEDVVAYRVRWVLSSSLIELSMEIAPVTFDVDSFLWEGDRMVLRLQYLELPSGTLDIGLSALDMSGNESAMMVARGITVDFTVPDPPREAFIDGL